MPHLTEAVGTQIVASHAPQREQRRAITAPLRGGGLAKHARSAECMGPIVGHEIVKRSQAKDAHLNPVSSSVRAPHNSWVEDNPYEAQIAGLSVPGWVWRNDGDDALAEAAERRTSLWTGTPMAPWWLNVR